MATTSDPPHIPGPPSSPVRFARWATDYDTSQLQQVLYEPVHRQVLRRAHRRQPHPTRVLDIGCGTGRLTTALSRRHPGVATIGIDPCAEMLARAAAGCGSVVWLRGAVETLPFRDAAFDLVVSTLSLRHWHDPWRGLAEIGRVTAPGAPLLIADAILGDGLLQLTTTASSRHVPWRSTARLRAWRLRHPRQASRLDAGLHDVLQDAGLQLDRIEPIALPIPLTTVTLILASKTR